MNINLQKIGTKECARWTLTTRRRSQECVRKCLPKDVEVRSTPCSLEGIRSQRDGWRMRCRRTEDRDYNSKDTNVNRVSLLNPNKEVKFQLTNRWN